MTSHRGRRGSHLDSLDTLLDMVDYACEHNIAKDKSDCHDFGLPPELPRAEFHDFLDLGGYQEELQHEQPALPPSPIVTTKTMFDGGMRPGARYNAQNVQELLRHAGAYQHQSHQQPSPGGQTEQMHSFGQHSGHNADEVAQLEASLHSLSSTSEHDNYHHHHRNHGSSGGSHVHPSSKSPHTHASREYNRPERLLDLQELAEAQPECPVVAPKVWLRKGIVGVHSKTGFKEGYPDWQCQDAYTICRGFNDKRDQAFFAVFDGHGEFGGETARTCAEQIPLLLRDSGYETGCVGAFRRLCTTMQKELRRHEEIDVTTSGCTACMLLINAGAVVCANVGDSRCVIYSSVSPEEPDILIHTPLTVDHKPDRPDERRRIEGRGGFVQESKVDSHGRVHPSRVVANSQDGGLAMSRSLGDTESHAAGVIPDPEIKQYTLSERDQFMVLASDGIWDVMDEDELGRLLAEKLNEGIAWDLNAIAASICKVCQHRWLQGGSYVDDITIILVHLPRLLFDMATDLPPARATTRRHSHSFVKVSDTSSAEARSASSEFTVMSARHLHRSATEADRSTAEHALTWQQLHGQQQTSSPQPRAAHPHSLSRFSPRRTRSEPPLPRRPVSLPSSLRHGLQDYIAVQSMLRTRVRNVVRKPRSSSGGSSSTNSSPTASSARSRANLSIK